MLTRSMIPVALVLTLGAPSMARAEGVPRLDVTPTCRDIPAEAVVGPRDSSVCLKSEDAARETLTREWASFPAADRSLCTRTATMGGTASYVELLTCLELRREVSKLPKDQLTRTGR